jgi:DNA primase
MLELNLQLFADEEGIIDIPTESNEGLQDFMQDDIEPNGNDLEQGIKDFFGLTDEDFENEEAEPVQQEPVAEVIQEPEEKVQSAEDNARFAEERRQKIVEERVQQELSRLKQQDPEYQVAQRLANIYGITPQEMLQRIQDAEIEKQSEESGIPIDALKQIQELKQSQQELEKRVIQNDYKDWQKRITQEAESIQAQYPMLTEDDVYEARLHLLEVIKNPDMPLEQSIFALHGKKIAESFKDSQRNEVLAEMSGRKKSPLPPQGSKTTGSPILSEEERFFAKQMGISDEEYSKY